MGLYDRDYTHDNFHSQQGHAPQIRFGLPQLTPVVKWLLIINVAVYFAQILGGDEFLLTWFSVFPVSVNVTLQLWRFITYQFLHGSLGHILLNMLGLFFLGPVLERHFGSKRFLYFYLGCGAFGGICYPLLVAIKWLPALPMIGASGAILGMLAACAILFPHFIVFFLFFPVPIRIAAIIIIFIATVNILIRENAGGEAAHLGGMAAGAVYVFWPLIRTKIKLKASSDNWQKKMQQHQDLQIELDRILKKVHEKGLHSLTAKEKRTLRKATKAKQRNL